MKKLFILYSFLLFSYLSKAQDYESRSGVYAVAGLNFASVTGWEDAANSGVKRIALFNGGLGFTSNFGRGWTGIIIEANFAQKGMGNSEATLDTDPEKLILNYIDIPVKFSYRPFKSFQSMYLAVGPQISMQVGGNIKYKNGESGGLNEDEIVKTTWSGVGTVGFNLGGYRNWGLEFSYEHGLTKFIKIDDKLRHSGIQARLIMPVDFLAALFE